uniref:MAM and LDL receptor class A domain containing 1 n=1 Tax=Erpetoichthys calabaricus TaxID=27687 RepID=A0A8C4RNQ8_ERPCA
MLTLARRYIQNGTPSGLFTCATGTCLPASHVCDFTEQCGDGGDEHHCKYGYGTGGRCDFEDGLCNWTQDDVDNFDWTRIQGPTPTAKTGPWKDHSLGTVLGHYLYIETSAPQAFRDTAVLLSPNFGPTAHQACIFRFHYHMFGQHVYKLAVYKRTSRDAQGLLLWAQYGEQGNLWLRETLHIRSSQPFQVRGQVGKGGKGDISLDDITFTGECLPAASASSPAPPTSSPPHGKGAADGANCKHLHFSFLNFGMLECHRAGGDPSWTHSCHGSARLPHKLTCI